VGAVEGGHSNGEQWELFGRKTGGGRRSGKTSQEGENSKTERQKTGGAACLYHSTGDGASEAVTSWQEVVSSSPRISGKAGKDKPLRVWDPKLR